MSIALRLARMRLALLQPTSLAPTLSPAIQAARLALQATKPHAAQPDLRTATAEAMPKLLALRPTKLTAPPVPDATPALDTPPANSEAAYDDAMRLPHRQQSPDAVAASLPPPAVDDAVAATAASVPAPDSASAPAATEATFDDDNPRMPPFSADETLAIDSLRVEGAMRSLEHAFDELRRLPQGGGEDSEAGAAESKATGATAEVPVDVLTSAMEDLAAGEPVRSVRLHLLLAGAQTNPGEVSDALLESSARRAIGSAVGVNLELLHQSSLLDEAESKRLEKMRAGDGAAPPPRASTETLIREILRETMWQRVMRVLRRRFTGAAAPEGGALHTDELAAAIAERAGSRQPNSALYAALRSDAELHATLARAFMTLHERQTTRWERLALRGKATGVFLTRSVLDFFLSHV